MLHLADALDQPVTGMMQTGISRFHICGAAVAAGPLVLALADTMTLIVYFQVARAALNTA